MNVYDFDGTIYNGDSTIEFFLYSLKRNPQLLKFFPEQIGSAVLYGLRKMEKTQFKEKFFCFLKVINTDELVESFWNNNQRKIYSWYLSQRDTEDIVISASPEFLVKPICQRLGIEHVIASKVDSRSGKFSGKNCWGKEKVHRLIEEYQITHINKFYSDSKSDLPLARIADEAYFIVKGKKTRWNTGDE